MHGQSKADGHTLGLGFLEVGKMVGEGFRSSHEVGGGA